MSARHQLHSNIFFHFLFSVCFPCLIFQFFETMFFYRDIDVFMCSCVHVFMCSCVHVFMCSCVHVFMCSCVHVFMCSCVHVFMCSCVRVLLTSPRPPPPLSHMRVVTTPSLCSKGHDRCTDSPIPSDGCMRHIRNNYYLTRRACRHSRRFYNHPVPGKQSATLSPKRQHIVGASHTAPGFARNLWVP